MKINDLCTQYAILLPCELMHIVQLSKSALNVLIEVQFHGGLAIPNKTIFLRLRRRFCQAQIERGKILPSRAHMNTLISKPTWKTGLEIVSQCMLYSIQKTSENSKQVRNQFILKLLKQFPSIKKHFSKLKQILCSRQKLHGDFYSACRASQPHVKQITTWSGKVSGLMGQHGLYGQALTYNQNRTFVFLY